MRLEHAPFIPDLDALLRELKLPADSEYAAEVAALAERAAAVGRPKVLFREAFIAARGDTTVTIDGHTFTSRVLRGNLEEVERVFPYVATCGVEFDALLAGSDDDFLLFALDCIKQQALGRISTDFGAHLETHYGLVKRSAMHPGSGDADVWPIVDQQPLFALLGDVQAEIGVLLTATCLMHPNKSVSGIYFPTEVDFITCVLCHRDNCPHRRAPFDEHLWRAKQPAGA